MRDKGAADPGWRLLPAESLQKLGIDALVTMGGDDTAASASRLATAAGRGLRVAHVPKTIDNDLPLPGGTPTFGFETARSVGVELVNNLMTDAIATRRWYLVVAMGRSAGRLALGIGKSAEACLGDDRREFPPTSPCGCRAWWTSWRPRCSSGSLTAAPSAWRCWPRGSACACPRTSSHQAMPEVERDEHGHVRLAELELDRLLAKQVKERFKERGQNVTVEGEHRL